MTYPGSKFPKPQRFRKLSTCQVWESSPPAAAVGCISEASYTTAVSTYLHWLVGTTDYLVLILARGNEINFCFGTYQFV